jgi:hypothetical protein
VSQFGILLQDGGNRGWGSRKKERKKEITRYGIDDDELCIDTAEAWSSREICQSKTYQGQGQGCKQETGGQPTKHGGQPRRRNVACNQTIVCISTRRWHIKGRWATILPTSCVWMWLSILFDLDAGDVPVETCSPQSSSPTYSDCANLVMEHSDGFTIGSPRQKQYSLCLL